VTAHFDSGSYHENSINNAALNIHRRENASLKEDNINSLISSPYPSAIGAVNAAVDPIEP